MAAGILDSDPICPFNAAYGDNYLYCSYVPILDVSLLAQLIAIDYGKKKKVGEARKVLQLANQDDLQKFDLQKDIPCGEYTKDGRDFLTELGLVSRRTEECPDEFHYLLNNGGDLMILGMSAAREYYSLTRDIAQESAYDRRGSLGKLPTFAEANDHLQERLKGVGVLDTEEESLRELRRRLISTQTLQEKTEIFDSEEETFKRMSSFAEFLRVLHCQDGIRCDTNTTMSSGKRAAIVHTLIADPKAYTEKDADWVYTHDKEEQLSNTLATIFGCGFLGEITCLKTNAVITRTNSFASGVGIVQEIHAVDAAAVFRRSVEATSCAAELQGFDGNFGDSERVPKHAPEIVKILQWPNMFRSHRASYMREMLNKRGIPTADSRGKGFGKMGINGTRI